MSMPAKSPSPEAERPEKLSQTVAHQILAEVRARGWTAGELLGTEAELMVRFGVGRATLAEAVRQVERQGAAVMTRGKRGGLRISAPASATIAWTIATYIELSNVDPEEILEAWRLIEVDAAGLAARQVGLEGVAHLRQLLAKSNETDDPYQFMRRCTDLRVGVAEQAANPALALFVRSLVHVLGRVLERRPTPAITQASRRLRADLAMLVDAIASGDAALAQGIVLLKLSAHTNTYIPRKSLQREGEDGYTYSSQKLAETVARRICDDIAASGWPVGQKLGDEAGLLKRLGVSRWVLRQALRLLETHSIVQAKRGHGGGWIVSQPDPGYTIDLVVGYLKYTNFTLEGVAEFWSKLLEHAIQLAGERQAPSAFSILIPIIEREELARAGSELRAASNQLYSALGVLSGNRVVSLLVTILGRFVNQAVLRGDRTEIGRHLRRSHREIVCSLVNGEPGEARRLLAGYMQSVRPYYAEEAVNLIKS
jgi:DNA-binding FadR family transcriptional regulator